MKTDRVMENYGKASADIQNIINIIRTAPAPEIPVSSSKVNFTCNVTQEEYCKLVEKTKEYIIDGDIFQAVISRQFSTPYEGSLINPYRVLRTTNPSPYMVYLSIDGEEIMSTSPETLVRLENGRLTTFPVAGSDREAQHRRRTKFWKRICFPTKKNFPNTICSSISAEMTSVKFRILIRLRLQNT